MSLISYFNLNVSDAGGSHKASKTNNSSFNINKYNQPTLEIDYNKATDYYGEEEIKDLIKLYEESGYDRETAEKIAYGEMTLADAVKQKLIDKYIK